MPEIRQKGWVVCVRRGRGRPWHIVPWTVEDSPDNAGRRYETWYQRCGFATWVDDAQAVQCEVVVTDPRVTEGDV